MTRQEAWKKVKEEVEKEDPEAVLKALATFFTVDAENESHPTVKSLLNECAASCNHAAFDYYASLK